jgi:IS5 family transposase
VDDRLQRGAHVGLIRRTNVEHGALPRAPNVVAALNPPTLILDGEVRNESVEVPYPRPGRTFQLGIKRVFGFTKVRYRGLLKNRHRLVVAAALTNLFMMRKRLLHLQEA